MRLCDALKEKEMDVRLRDRHVSEGKLRPEVLDSYLQSLEDDADNFIELYPHSHMNPTGLQG